MARREAPAGEITLKTDRVYSRRELHEAGLSDRHIQRMYAAHWLDMAEAPPLVDAASALVEALGGASGAQGSETDAKGGEVAPTDEKAPDGPENGSGADLQPEAFPEGAEGEAGAADDEGAATAPADQTIAAFKCTGFGAYYAVNAAGEKVDKKKLSKSQAEGLAASAGVPVLGQSDPLPGLEG